MPDRHDLLPDPSDLTRRQALRAAGVAGAGLVLAPATVGAIDAAPALAAGRCARLTPELTEGPYWVNERLRRFDVRANSAGAGTAPQAGVRLDLTINLYDSTRGCRPLSGVAVDIWHANGHGLYSDESQQQTGGGTSAGNTSGENFLRGYQITGRDRGVHPRPAAGRASFRTIWPGWYTGRAIHIHVRVRRLSSAGHTIAGYTTQIFFADADNRRVLTGASPYRGRSPQTDPTTDESDNVLTSAARATNIVAVTGSVALGFATTFNVMLDDAEVGAGGSL